MAEEEKVETTITETVETPKTPKAEEKTAKAEAKEKKTYDEEYVHSLHEENARRRIKEKELAEKLKAFEDREIEQETDLKKKNEALSKSYSKLEKEAAERQAAADRRFILSEARRVAQGLGIIDVDDVKVLDLSDLSISENDTVIGLADKLATLKKSKPHWFASKEETKEEEKAVKAESKDQKKKPIATPGRKDGEPGKDWDTASREELRKQMASYGVTF